MIGQLALGGVLKAAGMRRASDAADEAWKVVVDRAIESWALSGTQFTAEDVRLLSGDPPSHPNAFGARFHHAARRGIIKRVGYRESDRPSGHRRMLSVWRGCDGQSD